MRKLQISYIGLNNLFGKVASSLLRRVNNVKKVSLYDDTEELKSTDWYLYGSQCKIEAYFGQKQLANALEGADIIVIGNNINSNGSLQNTFLKYQMYAEKIADAAPNAILVVTASPMSLSVPLLGSALHAVRAFNPDKLLGASNLDTLQASECLANFIKPTNPKSSGVQVPVIGGTTPTTRVPLFSQVHPPQKLSLEMITIINECLKHSAPTNECSTIENAFASVKFIISVMKGLSGECPVEMAFNKTPYAPGIDYCSLPIALGKEGIVKRFPLPKTLCQSEHEQIESAVKEMKQEEMKIQKLFQKEINDPIGDIPSVEVYNPKKLTPTTWILYDTDQQYISSGCLHDKLIVKDLIGESSKPLWKILVEQQQNRQTHGESALNFAVPSADEEYPLLEMQKPNKKEAQLNEDRAAKIIFEQQNKTMVQQQDEKTAEVQGAQRIKIQATKVQSIQKMKIQRAKLNEAEKKITQRANLKEAEKRKFQTTEQPKYQRLLESRDQQRQMQETEEEGQQDENGTTTNGVLVQEKESVMQQEDCPEVARTEKQPIEETPMPNNARVTQSESDIPQKALENRKVSPTQKPTLFRKLNILSSKRQSPIKFEDVVKRRTPIKTHSTKSLKRTVKNVEDKSAHQNSSKVESPLPENKNNGSEIYLQRSKKIGRQKRKKSIRKRKQQEKISVSQSKIHPTQNVATKEMPEPQNEPLEAEKKKNDVNPEAETGEVRVENPRVEATATQMAQEKESLITQDVCAEVERTEKQPIEETPMPNNAQLTQSETDITGKALEHKAAEKSEIPEEKRQSPTKIEDVAPRGTQIKQTSSSEAPEQTVMNVDNKSAHHDPIKRESPENSESESLLQQVNKIGGHKRKRTAQIKKTQSSEELEQTVINSEKPAQHNSLKRESPEKSESESLLQQVNKIGGHKRKRAAQIKKTQSSEELEQTVINSEKRAHHNSLKRESPDNSESESLLQQVNKIGGHKRKRAAQINKTQSSEELEQTVINSEKPAQHNSLKRESPENSESESLLQQVNKIGGHKRKRTAQIKKTQSSEELEQTVLNVDNKPAHQNPIKRETPENSESESLLQQVNKIGGHKRNRAAQIKKTQSSEELEQTVISSEKPAQHNSLKRESPENSESESLLQQVNKIGGHKRSRAAQIKKTQSSEELEQTVINCENKPVHHNSLKKKSPQDSESKTERKRPAKISASQSNLTVVTKEKSEPRNKPLEAEKKKNFETEEFPVEKTGVKSSVTPVTASVTGDSATLGSYKNMNYIDSISPTLDTIKLNKTKEFSKIKMETKAAVRVKDDTYSPRKVEEGTSEKPERDGKDDPMSKSVSRLRAVTELKANKNVVAAEEPKVVKPTPKTDGMMAKKSGSMSKLMSRNKYDLNEERGIIKELRNVSNSGLSVELKDRINESNKPKPFVAIATEVVNPFRNPNDTNVSSTRYAVKELRPVGNENKLSATPIKNVVSKIIEKGANSVLNAKSIPHQLKEKLLIKFSEPNKTLKFGADSKTKSSEPSLKKDVQKQYQKIISKSTSHLGKSLSKPSKNILKRVQSVNSKSLKPRALENNYEMMVPVKKSVRVKAKLNLTPWRKDLEPKPNKKKIENTVKAKPHALPSENETKLSLMKDKFGEPKTHLGITTKPPSIDMNETLKNQIVPIPTKTVKTVDIFETPLERVNSKTESVEAATKKPLIEEPQLPAVLREQHKTMMKTVSTQVKNQLIEEVKNENVPSKSLNGPDEASKKPPAPVMLSSMPRPHEQMSMFPILKLNQSLALPNNINYTVHGMIQSRPSPVLENEKKKTPQEETTVKKSKSLESSEKKPESWGRMFHMFRKTLKNDLNKHKQYYVQIKKASSGHRLKEAGKSSKAEKPVTSTVQSQSNSQLKRPHRSPDDRDFIFSLENGRDANTPITNVVNYFCKRSNDKV